MARRKNRNRKNGSSTSVAGLLYLGKHLGGVVMKRNGLGQAVIEAQQGNWGKASEVAYKNLEDMNIVEVVKDGAIIGAVRRLGLGVHITNIGKARIRSV